MTDSVERVARAICDAWFGVADDYSVWDHTLGEVDRRKCMSAARAAIEALRDPSDEAIEAGASEILMHEDVAEITSNEVRNAFNAMLDKILE